MAIAALALLLGACGARPGLDEKTPSVPIDPKGKSEGSSARQEPKALFDDSRVPGAQYAADFAAIHGGHVDAIARAQGKPIAPDAPIFAADTIALHGNAYRVKRVSLLLLGDKRVFYTGSWDPHAIEIGAQRDATGSEAELARRALAEEEVQCEDSGTRLNYYAPLRYQDTRCAACHAAPNNACLVYEMPELADD